MSVKPLQGPSYLLHNPHATYADLCARVEAAEQEAFEKYEPAFCFVLSPDERRMHGELISEFVRTAGYSIVITRDGKARCVSSQL